MPTFQGIQFLERALRALAAQTIDLPWDFLAVDSGSTDGTWELLGKFEKDFPVPFRRLRIHPVEFDHGDTRNLLASRTTGDLLVFLTQDAIPIGERWLAKLAANFDDPAVAAAYSRNVPRPDADFLTKLFSANDPGYDEGRRVARIEDRHAYELMSPQDRRILCNFNDVASAIRREVWELHPFPRTSFGEDVLMARAILEAGHDVVYDDRAEVEHSHDYPPEILRERARIDARFNAEWLDRTCVATPVDAQDLVTRQLEVDDSAMRTMGLDETRRHAELERAKALREAMFFGLHEGGLSTRKRRPTRFLARRDLSILYVVHGFPPDTWAGTEVYTLNLAKEMQRRGHRVTILARVPATKEVADGGPPDYSVAESTYDGLRVLRATNRLRQYAVAASYDDAGGAGVLGALLERERFDLVHFMHLIHFSAGMVAIARQFRVPCVITCHDYWALCSRVQLIRPDGVRCEENMGHGCFLCVREKGLAAIRTLKRYDAKLGPRIERFADWGRGANSLPGSMRRSLARVSDMARRRPFVEGAYKSADLRISPSRFLRTKLVEKAGFEEETFLYSDNGMRASAFIGFARRPDPEGKLRFGFVGSLVWYKGVEVMLRAMKRLEGTRAVLELHGDFDPASNPAHAALAKVAVRNVRFRGRFDNARVADVYAGIDVLLVPSLWWENSPITIHEAFLTRTPVVASGIGGMAELVRDGIDGLHVRPGDDADLAAKMRRFLDEPGLSARLGSEPPAVKTIEEDAAATEYRYRALCCIVPDDPPPVGAPPIVTPAEQTLFERRGHEFDTREGPVEKQAEDLLLLRPGGAAAEFDLRQVLRKDGTLRAKLVVEQFAYGSEPTLDLGGRLLLDGIAIGELEAFRSSGRDASNVQEFDLDLPRGARRLRFESSAPGAAAPRAVRLRRIALVERANP
jgi:glycosyltransferase involved in cell wall biosynthesis